MEAMTGEQANGAFHLSLTTRNGTTAGSPAELVALEELGRKAAAAGDTCLSTWRLLHPAMQHRLAQVAQAAHTTAKPALLAATQLLGATQRQTAVSWMVLRMST